MADSPHLFEADKERIANEAKVRTALEQPDFAEREFEKWKVEKDRRLKAESFATAWAKVAWLAEGRESAMGRQLNKLQQRIGRQRKANREQNKRYQELEGRVEHLTKALESVDRQTPDAIGGEPYVIGCGALYKVRAALYGSGGPRPKDNVPERQGEHQKEGGDANS